MRGDKRFAACDPTTLMRLVQLTDSTLPIGAFSFSNGLETAAAEGLVHDAATLEEYVRDIVRQALYTDGIAALHAHRNQTAQRYRGILEADRSAFVCKMSDEVRLMTCRMGKKLAELSLRILERQNVRLWLLDIEASRTPGTYPAAQGMIFAAWGIDERQLTASHIYGVANMVLGAALRCIRVSHYDTQRILFRLGDDAGRMYESICDCTPDDICAFTPQIDILASLHEKGTQRMFMN